jgi:hypothetical protein
MDGGLAQRAASAETGLSGAQFQPIHAYASVSTASTGQSAVNAAARIANSLRSRPVPPSPAPAMSSYGERRWCAAHGPPK